MTRNSSARKDERTEKMNLSKLVIDDEESFSGGLVTELSDCCNAPIEISSGGLRQEYCSKCKKTLSSNDIQVTIKFINYISHRILGK